MTHNRRWLVFRNRCAIFECYGATGSDGWIDHLLDHWYIGTRCHSASRL